MKIYEETLPEIIASLRTDASSFRMGSPCHHAHRLSHVPKARTTAPPTVHRNQPTWCMGTPCAGPESLIKSPETAGRGIGTRRYCNVSQPPCIETPNLASVSSIVR